MEEIENTNKTIADSSRTGIKTIEMTAKGIEVVNRKIGNRLSTSTDAIDKELKNKFEGQGKESLVLENKSNGTKTGINQPKNKVASDKSTIRTNTNATSTNYSHQQIANGNNNTIKTSVNQETAATAETAETGIDENQFETAVPVERGKTSIAISRVMKTAVMGAKVAGTFISVTKVLTDGDSNKAAMDLIERKIKKTVIKTSAKAVMKPTKFILKKVTRKPIAYLKKKAFTLVNKLLLIIRKMAKSIVSKLIASAATFIISCSAIIIPCMGAIAVLMIVFGGGSDQAVIDCYENYIININHEYKEMTNEVLEDYPILEVTSFDGSYGRIDWRAPLAIMQGLKGDLTFNEAEISLLNRFKDADLYEKHEFWISDNIKPSLIITNTTLNKYMEFMEGLFKNESDYMYTLTNIHQTAFTDDQRELISTLYNSQDLFASFSPQLQQYGTIINSSNGDGLEGVVVTGNSELGNAVAKKALTKTGYRYWWGAPGGGFGDGQKLDDPNAAYFDCSGLIAWASRQNGINLPRSTASEYSKSGQEVNYADLQAGDAITFSYDGRRTVSHIGIYIGGGKMVHASGLGSGTLGQNPEQCVMVSPITEGSYFYKYIYNCRRLY